MEKLAFIDVETTGGKANGDRITEVAVRIFDSGCETASWQSLVNPGMLIPPFIQRLTGISDDMVTDAPVFEEVAEHLDKLTKGCVFVAHNARFDYAFFKAEYRRLGRGYSRRTLCTVKLAKRLYPQFKRHSMDALISRHAIETPTRHRAMADVDAMVAFYRIAEQEHGERFHAVVRELLGKPALPASISQEMIDALPESAGVYRFYGEQRSLLYVGKSVNIRQRVCSHFSSDYRAEKEMTLTRSVRDIEWDVTTGELGALLLEIEQIKTLHPVYNQRSRASAELFTFHLLENQEGYLQCFCDLVTDVADLKGAFGLYRSRSAASKALVKLGQQNDVCPKLLGVEKTDNACFGVQTGQCGGACVGKEDRERYNLRMQIAFHALRIPEWPYDGMIAIVEKSSSQSMKGNAEAEGAADTTVFLVDCWCVLGKASCSEDLHDLCRQLPLIPVFDLDNYLILKRFFSKPLRHYKLLPFESLLRETVF